MRRRPSERGRNTVHEFEPEQCIKLIRPSEDKDLLCVCNDRAMCPSSGDFSGSMRENIHLLKRRIVLQTIESQCTKQTYAFRIQLPRFQTLRKQHSGRCEAGASRRIKSTNSTAFNLPPESSVVSSTHVTRLRYRNSFDSN